jgi:hypothetical protein
VFVPRNVDTSVASVPLLDFGAGYVKRAEGLPKQGSKFPWRLRMNYFADLLALRYGKLDDGVLTFPNGEANVAPPVEERAAWTVRP